LGTGGRYHPGEPGEIGRTVTAPGEQYQEMRTSFYGLEADASALRDEEAPGAGRPRLFIIGWHTPCALPLAELTTLREVCEGSGEEWNVGCGKRFGSLPV
jgi:hypothetical protein